MHSLHTLDKKRTRDDRSRVECRRYLIRCGSSQVLNRTQMSDFTLTMTDARIGSTVEWMIYRRRWNNCIVTLFLSKISSIHVDRMVYHLTDCNLSVWRMSCWQVHRAQESCTVQVRPEFVSFVTLISDPRFWYMHLAFVTRKQSSWSFEKVIPCCKHVTHFRFCP